MAQRLGVVIHRNKQSDANGRHYRTLVLDNPLSPWLDRGFAALYERAKPYTLVDPQRCYELWDIAGQLSQVPGDQLEVGVWRGGSGCIIAAASLLKRTFLCDTFSGVVKSGERDSWYNDGEHNDNSVAQVNQCVALLGLANVEVVRGIFPDDHVEKFRDKVFSFVHIDVDVYQSAKDVLEFVWPRMPLGAVVIFDDYGVAVCNGITDLVDEYRGRPDRVTTYNLNGHAVMVKTTAP